LALTEDLSLKREITRATWDDSDLCIKSLGVHHTSPRFMSAAPCERIDPFARFALTLLVGRHRLVSVIERCCEHMGPKQVLNELAHASSTHFALQALIDSLMETDRHFPPH